jgi:redox-sensitive bicupin YhaK (pirin superfamily)
MNGLQLWMGLPEEHEEADPLFIHYPAETLPKADRHGSAVRVMIGGAFGLRSPVKTYSPTLYAEAAIPKGLDFALPEDPEHEAAGELAIYIASGRLHAEGFPLPTHSMVVFARAAGVHLAADEDSQIALIGGKPLGKRFMWWNFVSSKKERIEKAKRDWKEGRFSEVPGETESYPLPERDAFSEGKR